MPQKRKPPRLVLRKETERDGGGSVWLIRDGKTDIRTGCLAHKTEEAERKLAEYLAEKFEPARSGRASETTIGDVLAVYTSEKAPAAANPRDTLGSIGRLNDYLGDKALSDIRGKLCRDYAVHRQTESGARRELEILRAAINHYHKEYGLDVLPAITLPEKSTPRDRYLTRSEAATLLWACLGWEKGKDETWTRRRDQKRSHLARLVIIGLYTGTRPGAILALQWMANTQGGYADLERGVIFRRAEGERVAHNKRKPPVKMAARLLAHMQRWHKLDQGLRYVVHYQGAHITKPNKAFRSAVAAAGLDKEVKPHVLRHTRGTWLAQKGVDARQAAASLGLTEAEYERTYLHNDPAFQQDAANAY